MSETWYKEYCLHCNTENWLYDGDMSDINGDDIEGFKCRRCGKIEIFNEDVLTIMYGDMSVEEILEKYVVNIVDGKEMPK